MSHDYNEERVARTGNSGRPPRVHTAPVPGPSLPAPVVWWWCITHNDWVDDYHVGIWTDAGVDCRLMVAAVRNP